MADLTDTPLLGNDFTRALTLAADLHRHHLRKDTEIPYLSHLLSVAVLVLEDGGDEEEAVAALLHDALEDCRHRIGPEEIGEDFSPRVRALVEACTDTPADFEGGEKPDWETRKRAYLAKVAGGDGNRISLADKLHNARSILRDHRKVGATVWGRFSVPARQTLWYHRELVHAYRAGGPHGFLLEELDRVVGKLHAREGEPYPGEPGSPLPPREEAGSGVRAGARPGGEAEADPGGTGQEGWGAV
jgi:(p)ppGpp synthase/HD superfamily hydrolase